MICLAVGVGATVPQSWLQVVAAKLPNTGNDTVASVAIAAFGRVAVGVSTARREQNITLAKIRFTCPETA